MVFIGYSSKDRYTVVEPILFHLRHFGIDVWYDFSDMFLGDDRYKTNFIHGINESKYIIIVFSQNLFKSSCAIEELEYAHALIEKGQAVFFPVFYNYTPEMLPDKYKWVQNIIYNEVKCESGTLYVAYQIVERIRHDEVLQLPYCSLESLISKCTINNDYITQLLQNWGKVDERNYGVRMGILYSLYAYLPRVNQCYEKCIQYIVSLLQMNTSPNHLLHSIFEKCIVLELSSIPDLVLLRN